MNPYEGFYRGNQSTMDDLYSRISDLEDQLNEVLDHKDHLNNLISTYPSVRKAYEDFKTACQLVDNQKVQSDQIKDHYAYKSFRQNRS